MSQAHENEKKGHRWISNGTEGTYTIYESEEVSPGTKVILQLKEDSAEFAKESTIKFVIQKYSNFIGVPVFLNGKLVNAVEPLWAKDPSKVICSRALWRIAHGFTLLSFRNNPLCCSYIIFWSLSCCTSLIIIPFR